MRFLAASPSGLSSMTRISRVQDRDQCELKHGDNHQSHGNHLERCDVCGIPVAVPLAADAEETPVSSLGRPAQGWSPIVVSCGDRHHASPLCHKKELNLPVVLFNTNSS